MQGMGSGVGKKKATRTQLIKLINEQEFRCALSGVELEPSDATLDHIVPVSNGGDHSIDNLQVVNDTVNRMKGTLSNDDFIMWCRKVASWNA